MVNEDMSPNVKTDEEIMESNVRTYCCASSSALNCYKWTLLSFSYLHGQVCNSPISNALIDPYVVGHTVYMIFG